MPILFSEVGQVKMAQLSSNINEQLRKGLISFDQWLVAKNMEERVMLESLLQQGLLSEDQFHVALSAQRSPTTINQPKQDDPDRNAQEKEVWGGVLCLVYYIAFLCIQRVKNKQQATNYDKINNKFNRRRR
jgi:hypothetical protein